MHHSLLASEPNINGAQQGGPTIICALVSPAETVLVLHGVKRAFEIFVATRDGQQLPTEVPTKIGSWQIANKMGYSMGQADEGYTTISTNAFYDLKEGRYVIAFGSSWYGAGPDDAPPSPIFICASASDNPLGQWTCWALSATLFPQIYVPFCAGQPGYAFWTDLPQVRMPHSRPHPPNTHTPTQHSIPFFRDGPQRLAGCPRVPCAMASVMCMCVHVLCHPTVMLHTVRQPEP